MQALALLSDDVGSAVDAYAHGPRTFSLLFTRWMDGNGWSHPTMTALAAACMGGKGWLHSSQISGFRHAQTRNPGPRTFVAIERLNFYVHRYQTERKLIPGTESSNNYNHASAVTENGSPPPLGWWLEVFCGYRTPQDIDLSGIFIPADQADTYSRALGRLIRELLIQRNHDLIDDLPRVIHHHYPTHEEERVQRLTQLVLGKSTYSVDDFRMELPALVQLTSALRGPSTEDDLLEALKP